MANSDPLVGDPITEIIFEDELKAMARDAVLCHFDDTMLRPKLIRLHFVRDEVLLV